MQWGNNYSIFHDNVKKYEEEKTQVTMYVHKHNNIQIPEMCT